MDNIPDLIYFKDRESRFTRINKAHAAALGLDSVDEALGKTDADFFPDADSSLLFGKSRSASMEIRALR